MMSESDERIVAAAILLPRTMAGIQGDENVLFWHLLRSMVEWADHNGMDFDLVLQDVMADFEATP